jgi:hypothetical protein
MTWCLPCVTFGKTHHRVRKDASMQGYEPINTSVSSLTPLIATHHTFSSTGACGRVMFTDA